MIFIVNGKYHTYGGNARYFKCPMPWCFDDLSIIHIYQNAVVPDFTTIRRLSPPSVVFRFYGIRCNTGSHR